ncbi:MAG: class I SAM-dependent methyltransferase [Parcubacteria group bacterium]
MIPDVIGHGTATTNYEKRLNKEAQSFDSIVSERSANNKIPDIRKDFFNPYFHNNIWRNSEFVKQHYGASVDWMIEKLRRAGVDSVIEFGCGDGWVCLEFARAGFKVIGIDASAESISLAKRYMESLPEKRNLNLQYYCQNALEFLRSDQGIDSVVCHGFLHHLPPVVLEEFIRLVKSKMNRDNVLLGVEPRYDKISPQATLLVYALRRAWPNHFKYNNELENELRTIADELGETAKSQSEMDNESQSALILSVVKKSFKQVETEYTNVFYDKVMGSLRVSRSDEIELSRLLSRLDDLIIKYSPDLGRRARFCASEG